MRFVLIFLPIAAVAACTMPAVNEPVVDTPVAASAAPPQPPPDARQVEEFDTTTAEQRAEAITVVSGGTLLGRTVAALGDPGKPGFWLATPLVDAVQSGRLVDPATGKAIAVELRPLSGDQTAGSQASLAALRALEIPLTDLTELDVYRG